jgi:hypothetical protein
MKQNPIGSLVFELLLYLCHFAFNQFFGNENLPAFGTSAHFMSDCMAQVRKDRFLCHQFLFAVPAFPVSRFSVHGGYPSLLKRIR